MNKFKALFQKQNAFIQFVFCLVITVCIVMAVTLCKIGAIIILSLLFACLLWLLIVVLMNK